MANTNLKNLLIEAADVDRQMKEAAFFVTLESTVSSNGTVKELVLRTMLEIRDLNEYTSLQEVEQTLGRDLQNYRAFLHVLLTKLNDRGQHIARSDPPATSGQVDVLEFTEEKLSLAVKFLPKKRASGPDGLPAELLKAVAASHPSLLLDM